MYQWTEIAGQAFAKFMLLTSFLRMWCHGKRRRHPGFDVRIVDRLRSMILERYKSKVGLMSSAEGDLPDAAN